MPMRTIDLKIHIFENYLESIPFSFKRIYATNNITEFNISLTNEANIAAITKIYGKITGAWIENLMRELRGKFADYNLNFYVNDKALRLQIKIME
jgi:hypothetical protein